MTLKQKKLIQQAMDIAQGIIRSTINCEPYQLQDQRVSDIYYSMNSMWLYLDAQIKLEKGRKRNDTRVYLYLRRRGHAGLVLY